MAFTHRIDGVAAADAHQHDTVAEAHECQADADQVADELWAEGGYVRWLETRDWAEHAAHADWEASRGVVQFEDAYREAMAAV